MNFIVKAFTDGSCLGNPGVGGYGIYLEKYDQAKTLLKQADLSGAAHNTTNNRMEMLAIIKALEFLHLKQIFHSEIEIITDSNLIVCTINKGWKKKANQDLWKQMDALLSQTRMHGNDYKFTWIKGHAGHQGNERADQLANSAATRLRDLA